MYEANSSGELPTGSRPCEAKYARADGLASTVAIFWFRNRTMGPGVPAGAAIPSHPDYSNPGRPDSIIVGTDGRDSSGWDVVTASALIFPAAT